ncbi:septal ring lytic transglycosylase RlpA family protein [Parafilimonas terrae]|uniref:Probable endolytic peptidoglycan transglycosylase RlpA n=1 Tax=Parafilimonas terrae TaxID=1465490 RepID=A0A1I5Z0A6_9BACT|nr:septal ring lytic transglycosylase RlpA family protein [Parafilimonas terrae]SFQ49755.1 rare lipoprotein A [Parafilimonas terrae]
MNKILLLSCLAWLFFSSCGKYITETGKASYYGDKFVRRPMANGKKFSQHKLTAAHKTLPLGTKVRVINLTNHQSVKVRITDRGPFVQGRIIDLSKKAARRINMINAGVVAVEIKYKKKK